MDDEALGVLARAVLADLDRIHGADGRLIALARVIAHARDAGRDEALGRLEQAVTWTDPAAESARADEELRLRERGIHQPPVKRPRPPAHSLGEVLQRAAAVNAGAMRLVDQAPGPVTRYARAMLVASLPAQFAAQCGERVEFSRWMYWIGELCFGLSGATPPGMEPDESIFNVMGLLATIGGLTGSKGDEYDPEMMIAIGRRTAASFGSIARAAARMEGRADCDQTFWIDDAITGSIRGLEPYEARLCAAQIAVHVGAAQLATPRADDVATHRAHVAKCAEEAATRDPKAPKTFAKDSIAERSMRSAQLWANARAKRRVTSRAR